MILSTAVAVLLGTTVKGYLPKSSLRLVRYAAGALFIGFGAWTILRG